MSLCVVPVRHFLLLILPLIVLVEIYFAVILGFVPVEHTTPNNPYRRSSFIEYLLYILVMISYWLRKRL